MNNFTRTLRLRVPQEYEGDYIELFNEIKESHAGLLGIQAVHGGKTLELCFGTKEAQTTEARGINLGEQHLEFQPIGTRQFCFLFCADRIF